jgi:large subunit ribosomal protein L4e
MTTRPVVSVWARDASNKALEQVQMPGVFSTPIRQDLIHFVHSEMAKNRRQAKGVYHLQGQEHSAESWGTGRAVARIPRISGSGTSRSGQATFGNMCRKARMFAPLKVWRKWNRKINTAQRRHAVAAALAASACPPLVMARGHRVQDVPELPLVADNFDVDTTKTLLSSLQNLGTGADLQRVRKERKQRAGKGKYRNSKYVLKKGPLVIFGEKDQKVRQVARNLPGVDVCHVQRLNLLQLAPGGHMGRLVVFTKDAFASLDSVFGTHTEASSQKSGYHLNRNMMACADLARIINSDQVQSKLRAEKVVKRVHFKTKPNPLKNKVQMQRLNPDFKKAAEAAKKAEADRHAKRAAALKAKRSKAGKKERSVRKERHAALNAGLEQSFKDAEKFLEEEERAGNYRPGDTSSEEDDE